MAKLNKKGISELVSVTLMIVLVIALAFLVFKWISGNVAESGQKSADRSIATDICREEVRMRVSNIQDNGEFYLITIENLKERTLSNFLIRYEKDQDVEIKKATQLISAFETGNIKAEKPSFTPDIVKVIPQITLEKPEIQANEKAWWLCSSQLMRYNL